MIFTTVSDPQHIVQIQALQQQNLPRAISRAEMKQEGFVTCEHTIDLLQEMNSPYPHIIALHDDQVVAYALVMLQALRDSIAVLQPMFQVIDDLVAHRIGSLTASFFVMGQICIDKPHRGQGVFENLYMCMRHHMRHHFDYCVTEVSSHNQRSQRAHAKVGFKVIHQYKAPDGHPWEILAWAWGTKG